MKKLLSILISLLLLTISSQAATIAVGPIRGNYDFYRIQDGIDVANDGDVVLVAPREYVITEPIIFRGKAITVRSEAGPEQTTIRMDPDYDFSIIIFDSGEDSNSLLEGFTITGSSDRGISCMNSSPRVENCMFISNLGSGIQCLSSSPIINNCIITGSEHDSGINCRENSSPTITNCIIYENIADGSGGGGIYCNDSSPTIANCTISENEAEHTGGGIECINSSPTLIDCSIIYNFAYHECGGMYNNDNSHPTLTNCVFVGNFAYDEGGGMLNRENSNPILNNCIFNGNSAGYGGGILNEVDNYPTLINCTISGNSAQWYGGGISDNENSSSSVINCIIWGNTAPDEAQISNDQYSLSTVSYSNVQLFGSLIWPGEGNINKNPLFADPNKGYYHLKSEAGRWDPNSQSWLHDDVTSPCIDAGDPNSDWSEELWPHGQRINMGAYGGTAQASMSLSEIGDIRDLNNDEIVNWDDVLQLVEKWDCNDVPLKEDLDLNGIVDSNDLMFFKGNWTEDSDNIVPILDVISDQYATTGSQLSFSISASDNDGDELAYLALGLPEGAEFSEQIFSWTPAQSGIYPITFIVSDYKSLDFVTMQIIVEAGQ